MYLPQIVWLEFDYMNKHYEGEAIPVLANFDNSTVPAFEIYLHNEYNGTVVQQDNNWSLYNFFEEGLAKIVTRKLSVFLEPEPVNFA